MSCILLHLCAVLFICFPSAVPFSVDPGTAVNPGIDYDYDPEDSFSSAEQPGKQPPLIIQISPILSLYILALDFATVGYYFGSTYSDA